MARERAESGFYHVMTRGNGRQLIFESSRDRMELLGLLRASARRGGTAVLAWCLMPNHLHLVLDDPAEGLGETMQRALTSYARSYNARTGHVGHLFQGRYTSVPLEDDARLLGAVRYVHLNPERAGIALADDYAWSSYAEYAGGPAVVDGLVDTSTVLELVGGREGFVELCREGAEGVPGAPAEGAPGETGAGVPVSGAGAYCPLGASMSSDERLLAARGVLADAGFGTPADVKGLPRRRRDEAIGLLRASGFSIREIERMTGVGRGVVARVRAHARCDE